TITAETTLLWATRAYADHCKKAPPDCPTKQKKLAQRDLASMRDLMEVCALWIGIKESVHSYVGSECFKKLQDMFDNGTLDAELRAHAKAVDESFDWQKLSFVLEAKGVAQDEELNKAQSKINNALQNSLQAGWSLFETNVQNDQLQHRRYILASSGDEAKARAAAVASLEKMHGVAWKLVNNTVTEICPTWCNAASNNKSTSVGSPDGDTETSGLIDAKLAPWLSETLSGLNSGVRRPEHELILGYFNLTSQGVLSTHKLHYMLSQVTTLCHNNPRSFVAVIVLPNRAGDPRAGVKSEIKAEEGEEKSEDEDGVKGGDGGGDEEDEANLSDDDPKSGDLLLRDFTYKIRCAFQENGRNLKVRQAIVNFEPSSVYGQRNAFQEILVITSPEKQNLSHKGKLWKQGVVSGVQMLSRSEMVKPPRAKWGGDPRFTKVQEMKQYCGGESFISKVVDGLVVGDPPIVIMDMFGFDAWPGQFAITQFARGKKCACATVCHSQAETAFVSSVLATKVFSMARSGDFQIAAFPDFQGALAQIKEFQKSPQPSYQVCVATGDGSLVVRQSLVEFWTKKHPSFSDQTLRLLEKHNAEFNLKGLKRGAESEEGQTQETMEKEEPQLALGTAKTIADLESSYPDVERLELQCGHFMLTLCDDQSLWIGASGAYVVESNTELFGFGSGDFVKGSESKDVMSDVSADGRWLLYAFTSAQQPVILEKTRQAPSHLESHTFWNQVMNLNDLLKTLENHGEVNHSLAEHKLTKDDVGNFTVSPTDSVCFVLDAAKHRKKKAKVQSALTFGAKMNFVKIRSSHNIQIAWRLRLHSENGSAGTQLVPVRPCAITAGSVSIQAGQVLQIL
ncbi:unnamed protein product, partial [Durusdinium trenchii]